MAPELNAAGLWKLDPLMRDRVKAGDDQPLEVEIETRGDTPAELVARMQAAGLVETGTTYRGTVSPADALSIAGEESVLRVSAADASTGSLLGRLQRAYVPPKAAKRGHTKLPPRRP